MHPENSPCWLWDEAVRFLLQRGRWRTEWQAWAMLLLLWMALRGIYRQVFKALMAPHCCNPSSQVRWPFHLLPLPCHDLVPHQ